MFLDEARIAARIRHPNVAEILDLGDEDEVLYIVMEWVDGETVGALQRAAKTHGGIPLPIVLRVASQVCAGLHAAHELRDDSGALVDLIHRDISPANVLISSQGFVKIVDFGIAKSKGRMHVTRVGDMVKGKTPYLSPEQLGGMNIDRRSDIFSLGALLYVLTTGLHPFRGDTDIKTVENIALKAPVPLREILPTLNADFEKVVLKALEKDASKRFATAAEMQRALDQVASSIGNPVTDDDVAAFVKKVIGDTLEKRDAELKAAIAAADAERGPMSVPPPVVTTDDPSTFDELETVDIIASERPAAVAAVIAKTSEPPIGDARADIETDTAVAVPAGRADRRKIATMAVAGALMGGLILVGLALRSAGDKPVTTQAPPPVEVPAVTPPPVVEPPPPVPPPPEPPVEATVAAADPEPPATASAEPIVETPATKPSKPVVATKPVAASKPVAKPKPRPKAPATKPTAPKKFNPKGI
jgi:serine/threonine-protein kinase